MLDTDTAVDPLARLIAWHAIAAEVSAPSNATHRQDLDELEEHEETVL